MGTSDWSSGTIMLDMDDPGVHLGGREVSAALGVPPLRFGLLCLRARACPGCLGLWFSVSCFEIYNDLK